MTMTPAQVLRLRSLALDTMGRFFRERGFLEVDSPLLLTGVPVESFVEPMTLDLRRMRGVERRYLPPSPEASLKRALAMLQADCFEVGHAFRDGEEEGPLHKAHFRMLEWYRRDADWRDIRADTVALFRELAEVLAAQGIAPLPPAPVDFFAPWQELSVPDAFRQHLGLSLESAGDLELLPGEVRRRGLGVPETWQDAFSILLAVEVEPHLGRGRPTILYGYPTGLASQARPMPQTPWLAEQFEIWVEGLELGNSYSELTDPEEQVRRVEVERRRCAELGREAPALDLSWLRSLEALPPRSAGGSVGVDRTLMVFLGADHIDMVRPL